MLQRTPTIAFAMHLLGGCRAAYYTAIETAESQLGPALRPLRDQVLFMKHNPNARALASVKGEVANIDAQGSQLIAEINRATADANRFIQFLDKEPA